LSSAVKAYMVDGENRYSWVTEGAGNGVSRDESGAFLSANNKEHRPARV
jgi:hypothetical protein